MIVGAGPTGLGAAWRLHELGHENWLLVEQSPHVGGLATSLYDANGFTWDIAIHVAHSHYPYFDNLLESILPGGFHTMERRAWVRMENAWIPYPFQYNFRHLPPRSRAECLAGLHALDPSKCTGITTDFHAWMLQSFGQGITNRFLLPYNRKIWSTEPAQMSSHWLGERVPKMDLDRVERNLRQERDDVAWGPNFQFQFPNRGGTGAIWNALASRLPAKRLRRNAGLVALDLKRRQATLTDGSQVGFESVISTIPLPKLVAMTGQQSLIDPVRRLRHTRVQVVCLACEFPLPDTLLDKTWVYCPEDQVIFYRVTPFSAFSPSHVPDPSRQCSFLCEVSTPGDATPWSRDALEQRTIDGFQALGLAPVTRENTRFFHIDAPFGYPIPTTGRDEILHEVVPTLDRQGLYSRGRFGGWKYEVSNMDHSVMQGVEVVNRLLRGEPELTWNHPNQVNTRSS